MRKLLYPLLWLALAGAAFAGEVTVAVASNFHTTLQEIAKEFETQSGHKVIIVTGSSGTLYAQISHGAPYDIFLSADQDRVTKLNQAGKLLDGAQKPYAIGRLVLYARDKDLLGVDIKSSLTAAQIRHFAMADPKLAPYGKAALTVLKHLELDYLIPQKAVTGMNIGQSFAMTNSANAQVGFVALSQALQFGGQWLEIPQDMHQPILQDAGLLGRSKGNAAALAFYDYLSSDTAQNLLQKSGYSVPK